jgi:hypothetical protein
MNQIANGSINNLFENFSPVINKRIVETAAKESESNVSISQKNREAFGNTPQKLSVNNFCLFQLPIPFGTVLALLSLYCSF